MVEPPGHAFLCGSTVLVAGYGMAGRSAVRALLGAHALVHVTADAPIEEDDAGDLSFVGPLERVPDDPDYAGHPLHDVLVVSPGYPPTHPLIVDALDRGIPVWGEVELAWQLRGPDAAPWLALTGTNGKTTTVRMLEAMLRAAGLRAAAVGNVGESLIDAVAAADHAGAYDVLAVELSSQQLHFAPSIRPVAGALLNLAPDHLSWHGSLDAYEHAKAKIFDAGIAIANADDSRVMALAPSGAIAFTLDEPADGQLGVSGDLLVSRAFGDDAVVLADVADVRPAGRHNVANALAAAALVRAFGLSPDAVAGGLRSFVPAAHRNALVTVRDEIAWVDDSKATNPHAAHASLSAYERVVWIAGGQLKGVDVDELVRAHAQRLAAAVLLGVDRAVLAAALTRHAPDVPVITVDSNDDGAMSEAVRAAAGLARPGDTVLLAPAGASYDMFAGFAARGDAFAAAVRALPRGRA